MRLPGVSRRRALVAAIAATALTLAAWRTGGWFETQGVDRNLTASRVLLWLTTFGLAYAAPPLLARVSRIPATVFAFWTAYGGIWLLATWPGIIMTDTHAQVAYVRSGTIWDWFTYLHSAFTMMVFDIVPHAAAFGPIQILGTASLMAFASSVMLEVRRNIPALVAMNAIAALSVPVVVNTLLYSRDTGYSLLHVALALYVGRAVIMRRHISTAGLIGVAALTGFLSVYRGDGIALLLVVPLVLLLLRPQRATMLRAGGAFAAFAIFFHLLLPLAFKIHSEPHHYELSLKINPLGAVLKSNFYSQDKKKDLRQLGRVLDVEGVKQLHEPSEIKPFWENKWDREASEADWRAFNATADELLKENAWTVFANRIETFGAATGLAPGQFATVPLDRETRFSFIGVDRGLRANPPFPGLYDRAEAVLSRTVGFTGAISTRSALFWNFLPSLLLLATVLVLRRRLPLEAVVAAIVLCRVPLLFLAAPAAQFKYYYAVFLGGIVVLGFLLARVRREEVARVIPALRRPERTPA